jgi:trimethylamine:corrinoid methyltransferase-like protein
MLKHLGKGMKGSDGEIELEVIVQVGSGGNYTDNEHTLKHMCTTASFPG